MKRELKEEVISHMPGANSQNRKAHPDEKGTERSAVPRINSQPPHLSQGPSR